MKADTTNTVTYQMLFKKTSTGATQTWRMEQEGDKYRTYSGQLNSPNIVVTEWTTCAGKNLGKKNETSPEKQATLEVESQYRKKLSQGNYKESIDDIDEDNFFKPMLAKDYNEHPITKKEYFDGIFCQPKLDGMRCIAKAGGLWSRQGKPIISCPHILDALAPVFEKYPGIVLDGELYNHDLKEDFNRIMSLAKQLKPTREDLAASAKEIQYHVYDCFFPELSEHLDFGHRIDELGQMQSANLISRDGCIRLVRTHHIHNQQELDYAYGDYIEAGYEGQIIRRNTPYANKRTSNLLKRKEFQDAEYEIVRVEEGLGNRSGMAGAITYKLPDGREFRSGIKGGVDYYRELYTLRSHLIGGEGTVKFFQLTPDGIPRFPVTTAVYQKKRDT